MPKRKDERPESTIIKVRLPINVLEECDEARLAGMHNDDAQSTFLGYLVKVGLAKYKKVILPSELAEDEGSQIPYIQLDRASGNP